MDWDRRSREQLERLKLVSLAPCQQHQRAHEGPMCVTAYTRRAGIPVNILSSFVMLRMPFSPNMGQTFSDNNIQTDALQSVRELPASSSAIYGAAYRTERNSGLVNDESCDSPRSGCYLACRCFLSLSPHFTETPLRPT